MKTVYINKLGYLASPSVENANIELQVTDAIAEELASGPLGKLGRYDETTDSFSLVDSRDEGELRKLREIECFSIINRGFMGYLSLSEEQKAELQSWYKAGLDVTETEQIPKKPTGLV